MTLTDTECILRVSGQSIDVANIDTRPSTVYVTAAWRRGDRDPAGGIAEESGCNIQLPPLESAEFEVALLDTMNAIAPKMECDVVLCAELDLGIFVGPDEVMGSVLVKPSTLRVLAELGIELRFSAYVTNDDE